VKIYLTVAPYGALAIGENLELIDYELFPKSIDETVEEALTLERGDIPGSLARLAERIKGKAEAIIVEDEEIARSLSKLGIESIVSYGDKVFRSARSKLLEYAKTIGFTKSDEEYYKWLFNMEVEYTRRKLRRAAAKRDLLAIQTIRSIDDIDKIINMLITRVREWYSVHFPELNELVKEHEDYVRIISELGVRDNITLDNLLKLGFSEAKASKIAEAAKNSIGSDFSESDIEAVSTLSRIIRDLYELRGSLSRYLEDVMDEVAPNITTLVGPLLGARLLSLAGSLEDMAKLPASTIQVLGAEKALFRALRTGGRPPKHGVIFQYAEIHKSPKWQRGKIARALAAKLSIAAKVDAFTGRFIGDKLLEDLRARIEEIKKIYAKPPVKKTEVKPSPKPRRRESPRRREGRR